MGAGHIPRKPCPTSFAVCVKRVWASSACRIYCNDPMPSRSPRGPRPSAIAPCAGTNQGCKSRKESSMQIRRVEPAMARRQAEWIVAIEPWLSMGFRAAPLGRWLFRRARAGCVLAAVHKRALLGIVVFQPDFLLGTFIALLAVRPQAAA